jgi:hypothetical protein
MFFGIAEVMGSTPTLSISSILVNYGIVLTSFSVLSDKFSSNGNISHRISRTSLYRIIILAIIVGVG